MEHHVEKGWCPQCRKWHTAISLPFKKVVIGNKVKLYICYLSILIRLSYPQIISLLRDTYGFLISNGEIANILAEMSGKFRPEFERIKQRLQKGKGVHLDETGWRKLYLWVMASIDTEDVLYLAGRNRGNGHIDELLGEDFQGVRINDAYAAYKNKQGDCQQCLAHPHRKLRDLANSETLSLTTKRHCQTAYAEFSEIYKKVRTYITEPFDPIKRKKQKEELLHDFSVWRKFHEKDPKKLHNIRQQFCDYESEWLTCLDYEGVPCDNNKAERMLRHFVIKRKISFGTKTEKTSENFSILASVLMTYWKKFENNFFQNLVSLAR
ncbi:MAG: IS66 family transposase [Patescibacteria group bacterium]